MSEVTTNSALNQQIYHANSSNDLAEQVHSTICILMPRALLAGGFDATGELVAAHYTDYKNSLPEWIIDFFEHQFITDTILSGAHKPGKIFIASDKYLLVPGILYNETEAGNWLKKIAYIEANDVVSTQHIEQAEAYYLYAWPAAIKKLLAKYFTAAQIASLATPLFTKNAGGYNLQCCITNQQVLVTLYNQGALLWHQVFNYENAEDIAYQLKLVCKQHNIEATAIQCTVTSNQQASIINEVLSYFPGANNETDNTNWSATISLLKQLYTCAL